MRLITPLETERIQGFDDNWTCNTGTGMPEKFRYFCIGNALVVFMITRMAKVLDDISIRGVRKDLWRWCPQSTKCLFPSMVTKEAGETGRMKKIFLFSPLLPKSADARSPVRQKQKTEKQ